VKNVVAAIIGVTWIVFWIYWLASAVNVKAGRSGIRWRVFVGVRVVAVIIAVILIKSKTFKGHHVFTSDPWLEGIGLGIFLSGLGLAVWARLNIGRNWGTPMSQKVDPELVTSGPYRLIRNPIYTGLILAMVGTAVAVTWYWLIAAALLGGYFVYSAVNEERYMAAQFPETYPAYKRSTKMLVPFIF